MEFEASGDKTKCDKGISWMKSCRQCLFEVLWKFNPYYQKHDNGQNQKDTMSGIH